MPYPLNVVSPPTTQLYNYPIKSKMRAALVTQSQYATLKVQLFDMNTYTPVDLTEYSLADGVGPQGPQASASWLKFRFMEATGRPNYMQDSQTQNIVDAEQGIISCLVPSGIMANAGVYICEAGIFSGANYLFNNTFYLFVERGLFSSTDTLNPTTTGIVGPPTTNEIRIALRDQPEINRMIDEFEFDVADICDAIVRSILYWNSAQPPINVFYNTQTFPYRYPWLDGIAAHLYEYAASYYRRNHLKHQNAGNAVDDLNRENEYLQAWKIRDDRWSSWVRQKKTEINLSQSFSLFGSNYPGGYNHWTAGW